MEKDTSLLEMVRSKELELKEKESAAKKEAERIVSLAREEAERLILSAREEGEAAANIHYQEGLAKLASEKDQIHNDFDKRKEMVKTRGIARMNAAIKTIIERVAFP